MNRRLLAGVFVVVLLLIAGCASSQPPLASSVEEITGIFASTGSTTHARFDADGTYRFGPSLMLVNDPVFPPGEYWFEHDQLYLNPIEDPVCGELIGVYEVWLPEEEGGALRFVAIEDECDHRIAVLQGVLHDETGEPSTRWEPVEEG